MVRLERQWWQLCVWASYTEVVGKQNPAVLQLRRWGTPTCAELGTPDFIGHRLQTLDYPCDSKRPMQAWVS